MKPHEIALGEYGVHAIPGDVDSPRVLKYFKEIGHKWVDDDETAWCAAFVNWCLLKAGKPQTGMLLARSFMQYGVSTKTPILGDIVVLWRISKTSEFGHVGFFIHDTENYIYILGGNQSNQVNIQRFPKSQLLDYRKIPEVNGE